MKKIVFCEFNLDTACVELCLEDGALLSIDCTAVENELANSMYQRSELDWLIYNDPLAYAELILNGEPDKIRQKQHSKKCVSGGFFTSYQSKQIQQLAVLRSILTSVPEAFSAPQSRKQVHLLRQIAETV